MPDLAANKIKTSAREQFLDITAEINRFINICGTREGLCHIYVPHTTAGVTINEGADPSVVDDILMQLGHIVPQSGRYTHLEGNSAAHIKAFLAGASKTIPITGGQLMLGTWQKVFFCEFDGPRDRKYVIKVSADDRNA